MELKFDEKGLIPAAVTDAETGKLLTLAYMSQESLDISMKEGRTCFWSRSRNALWRKGETSGNVQEIAEIRADCDLDALEVSVRKAGPACHTGADSCFYQTLYKGPAAPAFSADDLYKLIGGRKTDPQVGSYTTYLFEKGIDKILKKVGEEATEVVIAGKAGDKRETVYEIADLFYHLLVLMAQMDIPLSAVREELASRHVVDAKVKQEKMT